MRKAKAGTYTERLLAATLAATPGQLSPVEARLIEIASRLYPTVAPGAAAAMGYDLQDLAKNPGLMWGDAKLLGKAMKMALALAASVDDELRALRNEIERAHEGP